MKRYLMSLMFMVGLMAFVCSCTSDDKTTVRFSLTDAPSLQGYQSLYIDVQGIQYMVNDSQFVSLPMTPAIINIFALTNGQDTLLGNVELNAGERVSQVRLILGDNNTLVLKDGTEVSLKVPSGQTSGLKINIQSDVNLTSGYKIVIDFNAESSVVKKGNGSYSLKPVIRGFIEANTSAIFGTILPKNEPMKVFTIQGLDTIMTVSDTLRNNYFMLNGLKSGTYELKFVDSADLLRKTISVEVHGGTNNNLGSVVMD
ncbi:MAG TPA: DUF4382 domain-containing protein [Paludibacter sp.]